VHLARIGVPHVVGLDRTAKPAGERARQGGCFRLQIGQRIRPRCIRARFRTAEKSGANLDCARAQSQRDGNPSSFGNATRSDNRNGEFIGQAWQQSKKADTLALRSGLIKGAAMAAGFVPLGYDRVGPSTLRRWFSCALEERLGVKEKVSRS